MPSPALNPRSSKAAGLPPLALDASEAEVAKLRAVFAEIDMDSNGIASQQEFRNFLKRNPRGWPLADLLIGQSPEVADQIITFWFRKLDVNGNGEINEDEFLAFFHALRNARYKEHLYADFLLNMFDRNCDGKLDRSEYLDMLKVLLGKEPTEQTIQAVSKETSRDDLVRKLHAIHCDIRKLDPSRNATASDFAVTAVVVVGCAVGAVYAYRRFFLGAV